MRIAAGKRFAAAGGVLAGLLLVGIATAGSAPQSWDRLADASSDPLKAMATVDCLLPGQVRRSGRINYIGPALPVKTTAELCEKRGGEYVAYDRASLQSTLRVWQEKADGGDAEAQLFVGQAWERGFDRAPDLAKAAQWYAKAAKNGSREAKLALAAMMETGNGIPADPQAALGLYREAMGLSEELVRASDAAARLSEARLQAEAQKAEAEARITRLQAEVAALTSAREQDALARERKESELAQARTEREQAGERLNALPPSPTRNAARMAPGSSGSAPVLSVDGTRFGRYYALVIGVQDYDSIAPLKTPLADAEAVAGVLERRYGFRTTLLRNPDYHTLAGELVKVLANRERDDNVLIYFAGHGELDGKEGFWLPRDASQERDSGLPNSLLVSAMAQFGGRTLLVIADSCFGAALAAPREISGPLEYFPQDSASFLANKGRYVISAGGETPVVDDGGQGHSVFSAELLRVLERNDRVLTQRGLAESLRSAVESKSAQLGQKQVPQVAPMREGRGYEGGKFYLVPAGDPSPRPTLGMEGAGARAHGS
jgi:uncharacterized caspase-like protein